MIEDEVFVVRFPQLLFAQIPGFIQHCPPAEKGFIIPGQLPHLVQLPGGNWLCFYVLKFKFGQGRKFFENALTRSTGAEVVYFFHNPWIDNSCLFKMVR